MTPTLAFPDPENWIELPGQSARLARSDLRPCAECKIMLFSVVRVFRPDPKPAKDGTMIWIDLGISVECPRCKLASTKKSDRRELIGQLDVRSGQLVNMKLEYSR